MMEMEAKRWWSAFPFRLNARWQDSCLNCRNNAVNLVRDPQRAGSRKVVNQQRLSRGAVNVTGGQAVVSMADKFRK